MARLQNLQKQLDAGYQHDRYLRDRLLTAIYISALQDYLGDRMPRTAQHAIQRTMRRFSDKPKTVGTIAAQVATGVNGTSDDEHSDLDNQVNY